MTDDEKRAAIEALVDNEPHVDDCPAPEFLARVRSMGERIRAILDDAPSVEWLSSYPSRWDAHVGRWSFGISRKDDLFVAWVEHYTESIYAESSDLLTLDAAKARAVALYVALRGVT